MVKHGKKDNSTMPTHPQGFQPLTWQEYVACQISIESNLIQQRNLRDLNGLFDTLGIKVILGAKLRDVIGYYALIFHLAASATIPRDRQMGERAASLARARCFLHRSVNKQSPSRWLGDPSLEEA